MESKETPKDWQRIRRARLRVASPQQSLRMIQMILLPMMLLWAPRPMQFTSKTRWGLMFVFAFALTTGAPNCLGIEATGLGTRGKESTAVSPELSREGTRVTELVGTFREVGRRWTFMADDSHTAYRLLENQTLERVCRAMKEDPNDIRWKVGGELTEFMNENFLLLNQTQRAPE